MEDQGQDHSSPPSRATHDTLAKHRHRRLAVQQPDVMNMGVMVPCHEILAKAKEDWRRHQGLSGPIPQPGRNAVRGGRDAERRALPHKKILISHWRRHCSRVHTPPGDRPALRRPGHLRARRLAQRERGAKPAGRWRELRGRAGTPTTNVRHPACQQKPPRPVAPGQHPRQLPQLDWSTHQPAVPAPWGGACSKTSTWPKSPRVHRLGPVFPDLGWLARTPPSWTDEMVGMEATRVLADTDHAEKIIRRPAGCTRQRRDGTAARQQRGRRHRGYTDDTRTEVAMTLVRPAPAGRKAHHRRR